MWNKRKIKVSSLFVSLLKVSVRCSRCHVWFCCGECHSRHRIHKSTCNQSNSKQGLIWPDGTSFDRPSPDQTSGGHDCIAGKKVCINKVNSGRETIFFNLGCCHFYKGELKNNFVKLQLIKLSNMFWKKET